MLEVYQVGPSDAGESRAPGGGSTCAGDPHAGARQFALRNGPAFAYLAGKLRYQRGLHLRPGQLAGQHHQRWRASIISAGGCRKKSARNHIVVR